MKKIGITGGIGSGKSIICQIFQLLGIPVFNADHSARTLMESNSDLRTSLTKKFGTEVYDQQGKLNRNWLAQKVFNDPSLLGELNELVHPAVGNNFKNWSDSLKDVPYCIREAAILFESGTYKDLDKVILVDAPEDLRIKRILKRDQRTKEQILTIIQRQWTYEKKKAISDFIIINDDKHLVIPQVLEIHEKILSNGK